MLYQRPATFKRIIVMKMTSLQITRGVYTLLIALWSDLCLRCLCNGLRKPTALRRTRLWTRRRRTVVRRTTIAFRTTRRITEISTKSTTAFMRRTTSNKLGSTTQLTGFTPSGSTRIYQTTGLEYEGTRSLQTFIWSQQPESGAQLSTSTESAVAAAAGSVTSLLVICGLAGLAALVIFRKRKTKREARRSLSKEESKQDLSIDNPAYDTKLPEKRSVQGSNGWPLGFGVSPEPDILAGSGIDFKLDVYAVPEKRGKLENSNGGNFGTGNNSAGGPYTTVSPETSEVGTYCKASADIDSAIEADYIDLVEGPGETSEYEALKEGKEVCGGLNQESAYTPLVKVHDIMPNSELANDDDLCVMQENDMYEKADWDVSRGLPRNQPVTCSNESATKERVFPEEETAWASDDVTTIVENVIYNK